MKILYIGRFELPDKEATANRVVANAKLLRDGGHEVVLAGWASDVSASEEWRESAYFGFRCYEKHKAETPREKYKMFSDASPELSLLKQEKYDLLIAYDFPAVALKKLMKHCRRAGVRVVCDVSEWYTNSNKNPLFRVVRAYDSYLRMRVLHKKADGLIVISKYLERYYRDCKTVLVPPLVDLCDEKWTLTEDAPSDGKTRLIYAGWPSRTKERLDVIVGAVGKQIERAVLDVYGINEAQYRAIYDDMGTLPANVRFHGRVSHTEAVAAVKRADFSVIIRASCRKNNAGFPSKLVESISCGTPALITDISNVRDFVGEGRNGYIVSVECFGEELEALLSDGANVRVERDAFDYRRYADDVRAFLDSIGTTR